jgi:hypothetical protein
MLSLFSPHFPKNIQRTPKPFDLIKICFSFGIASIFLTFFLLFSKGRKGQCWFSWMGKKGLCCSPCGFARPWKLASKGVWGMEDSPMQQPFTPNACGFAICLTVRRWQYFFVSFAFSAMLATVQGL